MPDISQKLLLVDFPAERAQDLAQVCSAAGYATRAVEAESIDLALLAGASYEAMVMAMPADAASRDEKFRALRRFTDMPIVVIASGAPDCSIAAALRAGADDALAEPVNGAELIARLYSLRQRCLRCSRIGRMCYGDIVIDQVEHRFRHRSINVPLSRMEMRLLRKLAAANENTVRIDTLVEELWGADDEGRRQSLRVLVRQLRNKIESDPQNPTILVNDHGVGYRMRRS